MNEDTATVDALNEIAALLRRRVEQQDEAEERAKEYRQESNERLASVDKLSTMPDFSKIEADSSKRIKEMMEMSGRRSTEQKADKERLDAETRDFREKLLAHFAQHNRLLERIAAQLEK